MKQVSRQLNIYFSRLIQTHAQPACLNPQPNTYASLLQTCAHINPLKQIHAQIVLTGLHENIYLATKLINTYSMVGSLENACQMFDKMPDRDVFSWNVMIRVYADAGLCNEALGIYYDMQERGVEADRFTFPFVLKACRDVEEGRRIHHHVEKLGYECDVFVGTSLVAMYANCGRIEDARQVFDKMPQRTVVTWSSMSRGCVQNGEATEALRLFRQMQVENVKPNSVTIVGIIPACADVASFLGKELHCYVVKNGFELDIDVGIALVDMYSKCNNMKYADRVFENFRNENIMLWNTMIRACATYDVHEEPLRFYCRMLSAHVQPDNFTFPVLLKICGDKSANEEGRKIHNHIVKTGFVQDIFVANSLVAMYAKCGQIRSARSVFDNMPIRDVVSWTALTAGYAQNGLYNDALMTFHQMQEANVKPNKITYLSVIPACAKLAAFHQGKNIHTCIMDSGLGSDATIITALINMYAKCGSIDIARQLFDQISGRNVITWNAIIDAYGMHGQGKDAIALFYQMQQAGIKPDLITFVCVLSACSHAGLVDAGWKHFYSMHHDHGIAPRREHYACMVDLLGRAGYLYEAYDLIRSMPFEPSASILRALLSACKIHGNIQLGKHMADWLFDIHQENSGHHLLLSNIYTSNGR